MFKILIVDDENDIRERILQIMGTRFSSSAELYQARNGLEAAELACAVSVDIIIADIKMPVCGGIEMMYKLRDLGVGSKVIIISGFDDYEFVREALKLGAEDYLLKPVVPEELTAMVELCLSRLDPAGTGSLRGSPESMERLMLEQQYHFKRLLEALDTGGIPDLRGDGKILFFAMEGRKKERWMTGAERIDWFLRVKDFFEDRIADPPKLLQGEFAGLWGVALTAPSGELAKVIPVLREHFFSKDIRFGLSGIADIRDTKKAWREAVDNLEQYFYDIPAQPDSEEYPFEKTQGQFIEAVSACDTAAFSRNLSRLFGLFCYWKIPTGQVRQFLVNLIYALMSADSGYIGIFGRYKFTGRDVVHSIENAASASGMCRDMRDVLCQYIKERRRILEEGEHLSGNEDHTVRRIKKYIEGGYRQRITLAEISKKLELHPNYLSTLFKRKTGITYGQYLRFVRIEKAKSLMEMTNLKLYNVAEQVGYNDNSHFYRAFKEETGCSPIEYKNRNRQLYPKQGV